MGGGTRQISRRLGRAFLAAVAVGFGVLVYVYLTLPDVRGLASAPPPSTAFMEQRALEAARDGRTSPHAQEWVAYSQISENLKRAVLIAEDSAFWDHDGIDMTQIRESLHASWTQGVPLRGASTITQQLAKNLYLTPSRDPFRKLRELILARRLEAALSKVRIFEIYLNVIEWGDGIWGAEAAARAYFGISSSALNVEQSAMLAGAIINPRVHNPGRPTTRLLQRQQIILGRMGSAGRSRSETAEAPPAEPLSVDERQEGEAFPESVAGVPADAATDESALVLDDTSDPAIDDVPSAEGPPTGFPDAELVPRTEPAPAPFPQP